MPSHIILCTNDKDKARKHVFMIKDFLNLGSDLKLSDVKCNNESTSNK